MCHNIREAAEKDNLMRLVLFSHKSIFHTCGYANRHSSKIWVSEQLNALQELRQDTLKVNVVMGYKRSKAYGPLMFAEDIITSNLHIGMLDQFLEPQFRSDGIMYSVVFQQDGAPPPQYALSVPDYHNPVIWLINFIRILSPLYIFYVRKNNFCAYSSKKIIYFII